MEWKTAKELAKELCLSTRQVRDIALKMVEDGVWEYRIRKEYCHNTKEYRRKKKK